jgi:hypothetical protein
MNEKPLNFGVARRAVLMLSRITPKSGRTGTPTPELVRKLAHAAEALTGIPADRVMGRSRPADVALIRQVIMFLIRESCAATWEATGDLFNRDHGTAIHAHRKIRAMMEVELATRPDGDGHTAALVRALAEACDLPVPEAAREATPRL